MQINTADSFADTGRALGYYPTNDQAAEAREAARAAAVEHYRLQLLDAITKGEDVPLPWPGGGSYPLHCHVSELAERTAKVMLLRAMHLSLSGKHDAANVALQSYASAITGIYGAEMAEAA